MSGREIDLPTPKAVKGLKLGILKNGHTQVEIDHLDAVKRAGNWVDVTRKDIPAGKLYSWWSYRAKDWKFKRCSIYAFFESWRCSNHESKKHYSTNNTHQCNQATPTLNKLTG